MNESTGAPPSVGDYFGALRRRIIFPALILPAMLFICLVAAFAIPPLYQSTATIMLEPSSVPKDIIESTVISYSDQQIEIVQSRVMTVPSLENIVRQADPYPKRKDWSATEKAQHILDDTTVERVDPVTLKPQAESNAFSLHYNNPDPEIAAAIDARLAQLFLTYNQLRRTEAAGEAAGFLQKQSEDVARQMRDVDVQLAALKSKYGEATPEFMTRNQASVEDTQRQLENVQQQILSAQEKESVLSLPLSQMSPNLITQSGDLTDVATVRAKLTEAEQRYTPDHPEVKRLKRALETLMAQSGGTAANESGSQQSAISDDRDPAEGGAQRIGEPATPVRLDCSETRTDARIDAANARRRTRVLLRASPQGSSAKRIPAHPRPSAERQSGGDLRERARRRKIHHDPCAECLGLAGVSESYRSHLARLGVGRRALRHRRGDRRERRFECANGTGCAITGRRAVAREHSVHQQQTRPAAPRDYVDFAFWRVFRRRLSW